MSEKVIIDNRSRMKIPELWSIIESILLAPRHLVVDSIVSFVPSRILVLTKQNKKSITIIITDSLST